MNSQILRRPIAVSMCLIALTVMGILALHHIPVSLMPDIDVPQITVQVSMPGYSAQEIEQNVVSPLRGRWMQVAGVTDTRSESRMETESVHISFKPDNNSGERAMWTYVDIVHSNISSFAITGCWRKETAISKGDIVITSGNLNLADGTEVKIANEQ